MPPTDRTPVNQARAQLQAARIRLTRAVTDQDYKRKLLEQAQRSLTGEELQPYLDGLGVADGEVAAARLAVEQGSTAVLAAITTWLGPGAGKAEVDADLARLEASTPVVLFPVRLETRFGIRGATPILKVRIYPDEILLNTHEYAVTAEERQAATEYWTPPAPGAPLAAESTRWARLVDLHGAPRAAYLARAFRPVHEPPYSGCVPYPYYIPGGGEVSLPELPDRPDTWSRAGEAVLPDRWVVLGYNRGQPTKVAVGLPIPEPLPLTANPSMAESDFITLDGDFEIDKNIAWTVDFDRAVAAGMAVTIDLTPAEAADGFERVVVLGVKSSLAALETSGLIEQLFDAHHYTRGLALVPQGTPTNNTTGKPTPFPPEDHHGERSFPIERQPPPPDLGSSHQVPANDAANRGPADFDRLATTLGVANSVFRNVDGALSLEQWGAEAMNEATWPATLGYFMDQMMRPLFTFPFGSRLFSKEDIENARGYFRRWVRGRGPVPAFRVGAVPYGVLPALALDRWAKRGTGDPDQEMEGKMLTVVRRLREIWKQGRRPATLTANPSNPFDPLMDLLSEDASSLTVRLRDTMGGATATNTGGLFGMIISALLGPHGVKSLAMLDEVGLPRNKRPRVLNMGFSTRASNFRGGFSHSLLPGSTTTPVTEYIDKLMAAPLADLWNDTNIIGAGRKPLLYLLLRHAMLLEYIRQARALPGTGSLYESNHVPDREPEQWPPNTPGPVNTARFFLALKPNSESETTVFDLARFPIGITYFPFLQRLKAFAPADLDRLLSETLDSCSHRLDAWITAFASHRLAGMRAAQIASCRKPVGNFLGGYGFVENVRPAGAGQLENAGFIHAPSQAHATAAALLRCGFFAHRRSATNKYAIDLSSERARRARRLLEEVRAGQTPAAALGYRFERGLHEHHPGVSGLDAFIYRFRHLFPQVANKSGTDPYQQVETVAARNVVDGLALARAPSIVFGPGNGLPSPGTPQYDAIQAELASLRDLFDAATDLLTAEAVFQMSTGDVASAQANLDALPLGASAPDSELVRSESGGVGVTHRVMLLLPPTLDAGNETPPALPAGWPALAELPGAVGFERAEAEPFIDAWVGHRLGDAAAVVATVRYQDPGGADQSFKVTLADLKLRPLDLLAIAQDETRPGVDTELERRILQAKPRPAGSGFRVDFADTGSTAQAPRLSFPQVMELARALAVVLGAARPITGADLMTPLEAAEVDESAAHAAAKQLMARARGAHDALLRAQDDLGDADDTASRRTRLVEAARLVAGTFPPVPLSDQTQEDTQIEDATSVALGELQRRVTLSLEVLAREPTNDHAPEATAVFLNQKATDLLKAVFGASFFALPAAGPLIDTAAEELRLSLAARDLLLGTDELTLQDSAPLRFLQQVALVREGMRNWRSLTIYARALGRTADRLAVMQLPHTVDEAWAGRAVPPAPGRVSLLAFTPGEFPALDPGQNLRGLMLDDWVEAIPRATEETAAAFHYDHPNAEAPQVVLVAVPAGTGATWSFDELAAAVNETFDLTDVRSIDPESLNISPLLPTPVLAFAPRRDTVSTDFAPNRFGDRLFNLF
jgi:hypothetical protein